uniref:Uncharacterized protein n=1 Tax=viral metagenome TaxID=1070528 RepID=A0A6C0BT76_9ZZZZ
MEPMIKLVHYVIVELKTITIKTMYLNSVKVVELSLT